jgi:predicted ATPase
MCKSYLPTCSFDKYKVFVRPQFLNTIHVDIPEEVWERGRRTGNTPLLEFPFTVPAIRALTKMPELEFHPRVTFLVGENGSGKSTLLEAIADLRQLDQGGGTKHWRLDPRNFSKLRPYLKQIRTAHPKQEFFLRAENFYNLAQGIEEHRTMEGGLFKTKVDRVYGQTPFPLQSHGEGFLALQRNTFTGHGLYLFDEPEAAFSVQSQFAVLRFIKELVDLNSQFIIATHSPIILSYPDAWIYRLSEEGIQRIEYEQSDPYVMTQAFLREPKRMLAHVYAD